MKIINKTNNNILADKATIANTAFSRMKGLLGRKEFPKGEALILDPCNSIHMLFMRFPIDVVFMDKNNRVVRAISSIKPFHFSPIYFKAKLAIELPVGTILSTSTRAGDDLSLIN
jgi:uncharacterized protein